MGEEKAAQVQKEQEEEAGFDFLDKLVESKFKSNLPPQDDEEESTQKPVEIMEPLAEEEEEPVEQENEEAPPLVESPTHSQRRPSVLPDVTLDDIEAHKAKTKKPKKQRTEEEKAAREAKKARKEERAAKRAEKEERRASKALEADVAAANKAKGDKLTQRRRTSTCKKLKKLQADQFFNNLSSYSGPSKIPEETKFTDNDFMAASTSGNIKVMEKFINDGVDVNKTDDHKRTALQRAALYGEEA